jgi:2-methylisocitrate lyase-like PEP mutase family enzyme
VLYAPGIRSLTQLKTLTSEVTLPFNVLAPFIKGASVQELASHGATRISLGGELTRHSLGPVLRAAREMLEQGTFEWTNDVPARAEINDLLR